MITFEVGSSGVGRPRTTSRGWGTYLLPVLPLDRLPVRFERRPVRPWRWHFHRCRRDKW